MPLVTASDLKTYLRIESPAEDALLAALVQRARSTIETWIDTPILAEVQTAIDAADSPIEPVPSLVFPRRPVFVTLIVDRNGETVPATQWWQNPVSGVVYGIGGYYFAFGPYTITAQVGLSLRQDFGRLEPTINTAILDLAADLYQRRTPGAASETASGTSITWDVGPHAMARAHKTLRSLKLGVAQ
jgi:hypothetical protein